MENVTAEPIWTVRKGFRSHVNQWIPISGETLIDYMILKTGQYRRVCTLAADTNIVLMSGAIHV